MVVSRIALIIVAVTIVVAAARGESTEHRNVELLDTVWETINTQYFDPTFGGLDWRQQYEKYRHMVESSETPEALYRHLNQMLFELEVSHLGVVPPEEAERIGDPQLFLDGSAGMDVRLLEGQAIVTAVRPDSAAAGLKIRPGYRLLEIGGRNVEEIIRKRRSEPTPPFNDRNLSSMMTQDILRELYGTPGDEVAIRYLDDRNQEHAAVIRLKARRVPKATLIPGMPAIYAAVGKRIISEGIGYIRFDVFHPVILQTVLDAIDAYRQLPGLILDLRGNPGGDFDVRKTLAQQFVTERTLFWKYESRNGVRKVYLDPPRNPYRGKLVILVDELSGSSSEEFAGGLQAIGRATIIGQQTAGKVLTMKVVPLPEGALFVYPDSRTLTARGNVLEGVGVVPDIPVALEKEALLRGIDNPLEKAVEHLENTRDPIPQSWQSPEPR